MITIKFLSLEELQDRRWLIRARIDHVENRLHNPPMLACWNKRGDLALVAELHKYMDDLNDEILRRTLLALTSE